MANPSLQIGNGKFAIKENDLLGYSSSGTRFFPIPITMTRATLGTRVNPSGLIENVELLGSELVTDGDFTLTGTQAENVTGTYWTTGTGWTISGGTANCDGSQTSGTQLTQTGLTFTNTKTYKVTYTVTVSAGNIDARLQGGGATVTGTSRTSSGTYTDYLISTGNTSFRMRGNDAFIGTVDNISVKEVTIDGLARVDYTDGTASLLVEPERTNVITYSEDFSQSYWTKTGTTVTSGFTSPDGTDNAFSLIEDTSTGVHLVKPPNSSFTSNIYTLSVFAKYNGRILQIASTSTGGHYANFDLLNGVIGNIGGSTANVTMTEISNGWYRCSMTTTSNMNTAIINTVQSATSVYQETYTGNGTSGIYIFGAQAEAASYPTSYIKTQGSTVTRNQDEYTKTGISDKINSEEGVLFVEMAALSDDGTNRILTLSDNSYTNSLRIQYYINTNEIEMRATVGGAIQALQRVAISNVLEFNKIAFLYKVNDFQLWVNGSKLRFETSGTVPPTGTYNTLSFDDGDGSNKFFGKIKQLQVFKTALSDSELATLTTI